MLAFGVKDSKNDGPFSVEQVKNFVGKSGQKNSPKVPIIDGEPIGIGFQSLDCPAYFLNQPIAKASLSFLIPQAGLIDVFLGAWPDNDRPFHDLLRNLASTSAHVEPA